jgi:hypothetical protein
MSEKYIHQITLDCLINKEQYNKLCYKSISKKINRQDKQFYRKRIVNLTKELLLNDEYDIFKDVKYAFEIYVNNCIDYFKTLDKSDILQDDYKNINDNCLGDTNDTLLSSDPILITETTENINKIIMKKIKIDANTLDSFITKNVSSSKDETFIPSQKEINLKDPTLRIKGIHKKKNIYNNYGEVQESDKKKVENEDFK